MEKPAYSHQWALFILKQLNKPQFDKQATKSCTVRICSAANLLIVVYAFLDAATLTEVFPCFFLGCKANTRVILAKTGHGPLLFQNCCVVLCIVCFVSFCVLFVCKCLLPPGDNTIAVNKYIISYHIISYHIISYYIISYHIISYHIISYSADS